MTNPFSKDYKPEVDMRDVTMQNRISKRQTDNREHRMQTGTPEQRLAASGFIVGMKSEPLSKSILKNSKLG